MENIVFREATMDDAEEMISYLNIVGGESDNLMHGADGFKAPVEAVKRRIQASHESDNSVILIAVADGLRNYIIMPRFPFLSEKTTGI